MNASELQPAIEYVQGQGTPVEQARLRYLLYGEAAPAEVRDRFSQSQRSDGGWAAAWAPDYSSLDATCYQLAMADQAGLDRRGTLFIDAVRFLAERQQPNGEWEEEGSEAAKAPPWAMPGETNARLYLTANCGFWVAVTGLVPSAARDAASYLSYHLHDDGKLASFLQTHWLAAALWQQRGLVDEASKTLTYLATRLDDLSAGNLAWLIIALREGGVPAADPTVSGALDRLLARRETDGHWPSDEGADNSVHVTIEALKSLQLCGQLP